MTMLISTELLLLPVYLAKVHRHDCNVPTVKVTYCVLLESRTSVEMLVSTLKSLTWTVGRGEFLLNVLPVIAYDELVRFTPFYYSVTVLKLQRLGMTRSM
jgi:hypothetical protein